MSFLSDLLGILAAKIASDDQQAVVSATGDRRASLLHQLPNFSDA
jgi:hypothetical protein